MKIAHAPLFDSRRFLGLRGGAALLLLLTITGGALAQSSDIEFPTPVRTNEISGSISPRDVGDSRLTRYFFSLISMNGDLTLSVESRNLNGDIDLFTAGSLRPLAKLSMYAGEAATSTSKSIYFKRQESLILRVEARSPNDDEGSFRIRFEGAFAPFLGEVREPEPIGPSPGQSETAGRKTKRVTATGARIDEPVVETAEKTPEPDLSQPSAPDSSATEKPPETTQPGATETETAGTPAPPARRSRGRRPRAPRASARSNTARSRPKTAAGESQPSAQPDQPVAAEPAPATPDPAASGPRLIIETRDGLRVERYMTFVRRVTVENGQIVVVLKNGKTERQPMLNVLKMSIEP